MGCLSPQASPLGTLLNTPFTTNYSIKFFLAMKNKNVIEQLWDEFKICQVKLFNCQGDYLSQTTIEMCRQSVINYFFQLKLTQEERKGNLNSCKLTENWRNLRRDAKTQELKSDVIILKETFDRALQKKNRHIELLLQVFLYCSSRLMWSIWG